MKIINSKYVIKFFIALFLLISIVVISQPNITYAANGASSLVGVVNYQLLVQQHPDTAQAQAAMNTAVIQANSDFKEKSASMSDDDKKALYQQIQQGLQQKQQELLGVIRDKLSITIKAVADSKGLTTIIDKSVIVYGGQDITDDVMKKITGK